MKTKLWVLILIAALAGGGYQAATAYQATGAAPRPAIITFNSSLNLITVADAENEAATTTLTWHTAGLTDEYRLRLHTYVLDRWEPVFPQDSVPLEANGSRDVTVRHPSELRTARLSAVDPAHRLQQRGRSAHRVDSL